MTEQTGVNLSVPAGDTLELSVPLSPDFAPSVGEVLQWHVYAATYANPYGIFVIAKDNSSGGGVELIASPPSLAVLLDRTDTLALLGNYYWEAKRIDTAGNYTTLASGILTVTLSQSAIPVNPPMAPPANPSVPSWPWGWWAAGMGASVWWPGSSPWRGIGR